MLPHDPSIRPAWLIRLGLMVYDRLAPRRVCRARRRSAAHDPVGRALKPAYAKAFLYSDCWVDDSRLVALVAVDAADRGATALTRTKAIAAARKDGLWELVLRHRDTGAATISGPRPS